MEWRQKFNQISQSITEIYLKKKLKQFEREIDDFFSKCQRLTEKIGHVYLRWRDALKKINTLQMATIKKLFERRVHSQKPWRNK